MSSSLLSQPPEDIGLSGERLNTLYSYVDSLTETGELPGACVLVARNGTPMSVRSFGALRPRVSDALVEPDTIFLVASITKPVTVAAAMLLVERGQFLLDDPVAKYIPAFAANGKQRVRIRHLMTHTSGLPDFLPENIELRKQHAPLSEFLRRICDLPLDFEPGTGVQYQSTGLGILGALIEEMTDMELPDFVHKEIFQPVNMHDTALGVRELDQKRIAFVDIPKEMVGADWGWNTPYWWNLAVPWGGMFSTASDLFRFLQLFLNGGSLDGKRVLSPSTVAAMTRNQLALLSKLPRNERFNNSWGLGFVLAGRRTRSDWAYFGDLVTPRTFGHGGATGTLMWADPERSLVCVFLTTQPEALDRGILARCSNLASAATI